MQRLPINKGIKPGNEQPKDHIPKILLNSPMVTTYIEFVIGKARPSFIDGSYRVKKKDTRKLKCGAILE